MASVLAEAGLALSILSNINNLRDIFKSGIKHGEPISETLKLECQDYIEGVFKGLEAQRKIGVILQNILIKFGAATSLRMQYDKICELTVESENDARSTDDKMVAEFWSAQKNQHRSGFDEIEGSLIKPIEHRTIPFIDEDLKEELYNFIAAFLSMRTSLLACLNKVKPNYEEYLQNILSTKDAALEIETKLKTLCEDIIFDFSLTR